MATKILSVPFLFLVTFLYLSLLFFFFYFAHTSHQVAAISAQAKHLRDRATAARDLADENNVSSAGSVTMGAPASFSSAGPTPGSDPVASDPLPVVDATSNATRSAPIEEVSTSTAASASSALEPMTSFALVPNLGLNDLLNVVSMYDHEVGGTSRGMGIEL